MTSEMIAAAEARWQEWHAGRQIATLGLAVVGLFALLLGRFG